MAQRRTPKKEAYFKLRLTTALFILTKQKSFIKSKEFKNSELTTGKKMLADTKENYKERSSNLFLLQMQVRLNLYWSKSHYFTALTSWFLLTFFVHYWSHSLFFFGKCNFNGFCSHFFVYYGPIIFYFLLFFANVIFFFLKKKGN